MLLTGGPSEEGVGFSPKDCFGKKGHITGKLSFKPEEEIGGDVNRGRRQMNALPKSIGAAMSLTMCSELGLVSKRRMCP